MSDAVTEIGTWGNSLVVRIPSAVVRAARLTASQSVKLTVEDGRVIITPQRFEPLTLAERLARYDLAVHGGEAMAAPTIGADKI